MTNKIQFREEVTNLMDKLDGNPIDICIQCGTCSATCPSVEYMEYTPRQIIAMVRAGLKDEVLSSDTIWCCASCYHCTVRCPKGIKITELMYALKRYSIWRNRYKKGVIGPNFSKKFVKMITKTGKSFEPGLAPTFVFKYGINGLINNTQMALNLFIKGRLPLIPSKINRLDKFRNVISKIIPLGE